MVPTAASTVIDRQLVLRIAVAVILSVASCLVGSVLSVLLSVFAALISGIDVITDSVSDIRSGNYLTQKVVLTVSCIILFIIGASTEGGILFIAYRIGRIILEWGTASDYDDAVSALNECDGREKTLLEKMLGSEKLSSSHYNDALIAAKRVLLIAAGITVIYTAIVPLVFPVSFKETLRRALCVFCLCNTVNFPVPERALITDTSCRLAAKGIFVRNPEAISKLYDCNLITVEREGLLTECRPEDVSFYPNGISEDKFKAFCAYATFRSEQKFCKAIMNAAGSEINDSLVEEFKEIPGIGTGITINGLHVVLAEYSYYEKRGVTFPEADHSGLKYYLTVNSTYLGFVLINGELDFNSYKQWADSMHSYGFEKCALFSSEGPEKIGDEAFELRFDLFYPECSVKHYDAALKNFAGNSGKILFLNSRSERFKNAKCNISTNREGNSDIVFSDSINGITKLLSICADYESIEKTNIIVAFAVKCILIFLAFSGLNSCWFTVIIEMLTAGVLVLNSNRISRISIDDET